MTEPGLLAPDARTDLLPAIRVPLLLMALGALFLVQDFGGLPFSRSWPALLVLWGVLLALGRRGREP